MSRTSRMIGIVTADGDYVREGALAGYATKASSGSRQLDHESDKQLAGQLLRPKYSPTVLAGALELSTWHLRACRVKAGDVAGSGWRIVKESEDSADADRARLETFLGELIPRGGDLHEAPLLNLFERAQLDYESVGYAALELIREGYGPGAPLVNVVHVPAHTIRMAKDRQRFAQKVRGKTRWFRAVGADVDVDFEHGLKRDPGRLPADRRASELLFWTNYNPNELNYGLPDYIPALGAIHGDLGRRDYNLAFFQNYGVPAYAVIITGDFDPGEEDPDTGLTPLEQQIADHSKNLRKHPHANLVLALPSRENVQDNPDGKVEVAFKPLGTEVKEASFRLYRQDNATEILAAHGVPEARVGTFRQGAANRESSEVYKRSVIDPRQRTLTALVNRYIIRDGLGISGWKFELIEFDNRDEKHDLDILTDLESVQAVQSEEIRAYFAGRFGLEGSGQQQTPRDRALAAALDMIKGAPSLAQNPGVGPLVDQLEAVLSGDTPEPPAPDAATLAQVQDAVSQVRGVAAELARARRNGSRAS